MGTIVALCLFDQYADTRASLTNALCVPAVVSAQSASSIGFFPSVRENHQPWVWGFVNISTNSWETTRFVLSGAGLKYLIQATHRNLMSAIGQTKALFVVTPKVRSCAPPLTELKP